MAFLDDLSQARAGLGFDPRRLGLLDALQRMAADGTFQQQVNAAGDAQLAAAKDQIGLQFQGADSTNLANAASRGLLGSSVARGARAQAVASRDAATTNAATAVQDYKQGAGDARESELYQYLAQIMSPSAGESANDSITIGGMGFERDMNRAMTGVQNMYRNGLSEALGSFLENGVAPVIGSGFRRADRMNAADERWNVRNQGQPARDANRTFSLFD